MSPGHAGLSLDHVTLRVGAAGGVRLGPITAHVPPGGVLAVTGPSGAGKSSLLAWIAGVAPEAVRGDGQIRVDGERVDPWPAERRGIGLVFQDDLLFPHMTVRENLLFATPRGPRPTREQAVAAALQRAGLDGQGGRRPGSLSGGQRARVALLRALLAQPRVLLLDEPYARLDPALRERLRAWVWAQLSERGVPVLLVTHDAADVPPGAQRLALPMPASHADDAADDAADNHHEGEPEDGRGAAAGRDARGRGHA